MRRTRQEPIALAVATMLAILTTTSACAQAPPDGWRADVDAMAERVIDAGLAPGMGIAVTMGDSVVYARGFGVADMETGRPVDETTAFYIASSTKALTATAVVLLAERGEIDLDAPVGRYLPTLSLQPPLDADAISIDRLLTMTHGIRDGGPVVLRTAFTGDFTPELLIRILGTYPPSESGTAFRYGNLGYNILGLVLDPDDGEGWKAVVRREVLDPLGMDATSARLSALDPALLAMPHSFEPGEGAGFGRVPLAKADANLHAAGGHFATPADLARFVAAHASGGTLEGRRVFPARAITATHERHAAQDREFGPFHRHGWGYGWDLGTFEGDTLIHRFGSFTGYRSHMSFMPEHGIGVVVLVNGDGPASPAADLVATYVYDRFREEAEVPDPSDPSDASNLADAYDVRLAELEAAAAAAAQELAEHRAERAARQGPLPHPLPAYAGTYEHPALGSMTWAVRDDESGLTVTMGVAESEAEVYAAAEDQLRVELTGGGEIVDFTFPDADGPAESVDYSGFTLQRVRE